MRSFYKLSADIVLCTHSKNMRFAFQFWFQLFLCYFLPFVNYYQWKLKIPKQFSNITSLVSCMLWCIVSCIISWHLYRDMYRFLIKSLQPYFQQVFLHRNRWSAAAAQLLGYLTLISKCFQHHLKCSSAHSKVAQRIKRNSFFDKPLYASVLSATSCTMQSSQ